MYYFSANENPHNDPRIAYLNSYMKALDEAYDDLCSSVIPTSDGYNNGAVVFEVEDPFDLSAQIEAEMGRQFVDVYAELVMAQLAIKKVGERILSEVAAEKEKAEDVDEVERSIVSLYGEDSVLLHIDVIRGESGIVDLVKTKASLQIKKEDVVNFYCCFDWCCNINLSLNKEGYVCNRKDNGASRGACDEWYCASDFEEVKETPTTAILRSLIEPLEFWDYTLERHFRELQETFSWKFEELREKEKITLLDKLFPGLKYRVEKPTGIVYLIGSKSGGIFKIGYSENLEQRLKQLQSGCGHTLEIIKTKKGTRKTEKEEHIKARKCRVGAEWFTWDESIIANF